METQEHQTHPLVEKAAAGWLELAARYEVVATVERGNSSYSATAVTIRFETNNRHELASVLIYPPVRRGRTVRQTPVVCTYRPKRGKIVFGADPHMTLRRLRDRLIWGWSPTAKQRLQASIAASRAHLTEMSPL